MDRPGTDRNVIHPSPQADYRDQSVDFDPSKAPDDAYRTSLPVADPETDRVSWPPPTLR